jgi:AcrR family transcriptional regulator
MLTNGHESLIKKRILDAAEENFIHLGYHKTTMSDISRECGMSPANLYRYFDGKGGLAVAVATRFLQGMEEKLEAIAEDRQSTAGVRLEQFVLTAMREARSFLRNRASGYDLVDFIFSRHYEMIDTHVRKKTILFETIIRQGVESGEFAPTDPVRTAEYVLYATARFHAPYYMHLDRFSDDEFAKLAKGVVNILINGLKAA